MTQQTAFEYLRHGQTPFFRLPSVDFARSRDELYRGADIVLLGVPFDAGTTYQPGARFAPYHLRRVSALVQGWHPVHELDVFRALRAVDGGNVAFPPFDRAAMRDAVQGEVGLIASASAVPFVVGGDHSVALPALRAIAEVHDPVAVIHLDAHLDTSGPEVWGEDHHHGTPLRHAIAEGLIAPGQLHQIGLRGPWGGADDGKLAAAHGGLRFWADEVTELGAAAIGAALGDAIGDRPVYLSIDVDVLDPAFAPGTGTPVPGGLTSREVIALLRALAGVDLVGADLVEVCPALDHADLTCHLGAHLLYEAMALVARQR